MDGNVLGNSKSEIHFYQSVTESLKANENILWASSPKGAYSIYALQKNHFNKFERWIIYVLLLGGITICFYAGLYDFALLGMLYFPYRFVVDSFAILHQARTHYALTEKRLFIQTWRRFRKRLNYINLVNIRALQMVETIDKLGTVFIMCYKHPGIYTVDYSDGEVQVCPTMEDIEHPQQVINLIEKIKSLS